MMRTLTRRLALVTLLASSLFAVGCDQGSGTATTRSANATAGNGSTASADAVAKSRGNVFSFINRGDVITLDLNQMSYLQDFRITYALREGLYKPDPKTLEPKFALARDVKVSDDKKTWTFTLRDDGKWSNGDAVTAKDFVFSWRLLLESPGQYTSLFYYIKGAKAFSEKRRAGEPASFDDVGIKSPDDHTLIVTLENPLPFLPDLMTFPTFYPRNERSMEPFKQKADAKGRVSYDAAYSQAGNLVGNGPYVLKEWSPGKQLVLVKNSTYRAADHIKLDGITMIVNIDPQSAFVQYENGEVDWMADVSAEIGYNLKKEGRKDLIVAPAFGTAFLTVNCGENVPELQGKKNPLADVRVRQALAMTIDKKTVVDSITRMGELPADSYMPHHFYAGWTSTPVQPMDVAKAKQLLADAGYPDGKGFGALSITYNSDSPTRRDVAEFLHSQWLKHLGVNIELHPLELNGYRDYITNKQYTLGLGAWYGDYQDPSTWTDKYAPDNENNDSNWEPPAYNEILQKAKVEPDEGKRAKLLMDAESMINAELPIIPLYYYVNFTLQRRDVKDLPLNARNTTIWDDVSLERPK